MGPPEELVRFCEREHARLVGALSLYCGDRLLAEEFAQEALVRACQRWESVRVMAAPGAWVHRVAINLANSRFRRAKARRRALDRHASGQRWFYRDPDAVDSVALRRAVSDLPARQREAVVFRFFLDWSVEETAHVMGASSSSVRSLTHRAMKRLRAVFELTDELDRGPVESAPVEEVRDGT